MIIELNENDKKLLMFCSDRERSISEIARFLKISPKNVSVRLDKLKNASLIKINSRGLGKKTSIRTKSADKTKKYILDILKIIKEKGEINRSEFANLPGYNPNVFLDPNSLDKQSAIDFVSLSNLIEQTVKLSDKGKEYLKKKGSDVKDVGFFYP